MDVNTRMAVKNKSLRIASIFVCLAVGIGILLIPNNQKTSTQVNLSEYSSINTICELATLKSYYHNVAMYEENPEGGNKFVNDILIWPFGVYARIGYKQFWLEYSGIVETGIDASLIRIVGPNAQGVVDVYIPDAVVLNVYADEGSLSEPLSDTGLFTTITGKEKAEAFSAAQSAMRQEAENDQALLKRSKDNAKILLERFIINTAKGIGTELSINWLDNP